MGCYLELLRSNLVLRRHTSSCKTLQQWSQTQFARGPQEAVPGCYQAAQGRCERLWTEIFLKECTRQLKLDCREGCYWKNELGAYVFRKSSSPSIQLRKSLHIQLLMHKTFLLLLENLSTIDAQNLRTIYPEEVRFSDIVLSRECDTSTPPSWRSWCHIRDPTNIVNKYPQLPLLAWNADWCLAVMECMKLVCLNLSLTWDKGRSFLRDPLEDHCSCGPHKYYIFFSGEGRNILLWGRKWPTGRSLRPLLCRSLLRALLLL